MGQSVAIYSYSHKYSYSFLNHNQLAAQHIATYMYTVPFITVHAVLIRSISLPNYHVAELIQVIASYISLQLCQL